MSLASAVRSGRAEFAQLWRLAWPVVLGEIGWQTMSLVDTLVVGRVGATALAGVSVGGAVFFLAAISGTGMLLGLDFAIARAVGAERRDEVASFLRHGLLLAVALAVVLTAVLLAAAPLLPRLGLAPDVATVAADYLAVVAWSLPPLLLFNALRRFLQAVGSVRVIALAMVSANVINAVVDWMLVFGLWGAPALGAVGAAWATVVSRVFMLAVIVVYVVAAHRSTLVAHLPWRWAALQQLVRLGLPAAIQVALEVGVFATVTALAGRIGAVAAASHHVVLNIAAFSFMVPLGISAAAAVRVGHEVGRRDAVRTVTAGWTAMALGALTMAGFSALFLLVPSFLVALFTTDAAVRETAASLMMVAAVFQLFDGVQVVASGALRGLGDTRTPMLVNLIAHWFVGLPIGALLGLGLDFGVAGLWVGLCAGLMVAAVLLVWKWSVLSHAAPAGRA
jgi:MATE family multidrug resistance protein